MCPLWYDDVLRGETGQFTRCRANCFLAVTLYFHTEDPYCLYIETYPNHTAVSPHLSIPVYMGPFTGYLDTLLTKYLRDALA
jgi:hypothetical protein